LAHSVRTIQALSRLVDIDLLAQRKAPTTTLLCRDGVVFTAPTKEQQSYHVDKPRPAVTPFWFKG
jgi:hypothetical protein